MNKSFANEAEWQSIFREALGLWANASTQDGFKTVLKFVEVIDDGAAFDAFGSQGDIRFGAHGFDGTSGTLAHGYYAPPNGNTAAGDIHLDEAEAWQDLRNSTISATTSVRTQSPSQAHSAAAGFVSGLVGSDVPDEPLIAASVSSWGQELQVADQEEYQHEELADDEELGRSPIAESFRIAPIHTVDKLFLDTEKVSNRTDRTKQSDLDANGVELEETLLIHLASVWLERSGNTPS